MGGRRCEGYGVCSDAAQQHFALGKMLGGRSAVKKVCGDFFDKLSKAQASACALLSLSKNPGFQEEKTGDLAYMGLKIVRM